MQVTTYREGRATWGIALGLALNTLGCPPTPRDPGETWPEDDADVEVDADPGPDAAPDSGETADDAPDVAVDLAEAVGDDAPTDAAGDAPEATSCTEPQRVVFADGELGAGWSESLTASSQAGSTFAARQATDGGNPGAYRSFDLSNVGGPASVCVISMNAAATYDPASSGRVDALAARFDAATPGSADANLQTAFSPLVKQGDALYWVGRQRLFVRASDGWTAGAWTLADLRVFPEQDAGATIDADGAPLELGVLVCVSGTRTDSGIDNWSFELVSCP